MTAPPRLIDPPPVVALVAPVSGAPDVVRAAVASSCGGRVVLLDVLRPQDGLVRRAQVRGEAVRAVLSEPGFDHLRSLAEIVEKGGAEVSLAVHEGDLLTSIETETRLTGAGRVVLRADRSVCRAVEAAVSGEVALQVLDP